MRTAITVHLKGGKWSVISGPDVPIDQQKQAFKDLVLSDNPYGVEQVQIWESGSGITKRKTFDAGRAKGPTVDKPLEAATLPVKDEAETPDKDEGDKPRARLRRS